MTLKLPCRHCGTNIEHEDWQSGSEVKCPACGQRTILSPDLKRNPTPPGNAASASTPSPQSQRVFSGIGSGQGTAIILILLAIFFLPFFHSTSVLPPQQWEYQIVSVPDNSFTEKLNVLGANGWELVFARRASDGNEAAPTFSYEIILKRPKRLQ
jgi:DNA-directed RNA polymerase subunit RPC12/RpoP